MLYELVAVEPFPVITRLLWPVGPCVGLQSHSTDVDRKMMTKKKKLTTILIICVWYGRKTKGTTTTTTTTEKQQKLCDKWNLYLNWTAARQETTNKFDKIKCLEDFARLNTIITIKRAVVIDTAFSSNDSKAINAVRTFCPPGQPRTWSFYD